MGRQRRRRAGAAGVPFASWQRVARPAAVNAATAVSVSSQGQICAVRAGGPCVGGQASVTSAFSCDSVLCRSLLGCATGYLPGGYGIRPNCVSSVTWS